MPGYLITYRDSGWRGQMVRHDFADAAGFFSWVDAENDKLSSFKFMLPVGWDLRIHENRSTVSRCKVWRGTGSEVWVDKAELPSFIHDQASGHAWVRLGYPDVFQAFRALQPEGPADLTFTLPGGLSLPTGARGDSKWHQQGIQRLPDGGWVVTGSAPSTGYLYTTDAAGTIRAVHQPQVSNFNHLGGCQVAGGVLAVGYERFENGAGGNSRILFFDVRNGIPAAMPHLAFDRNDTGGAVGLVSAGDRWVLVVANWNAARLDFHFSDRADLFDPLTRFHPAANGSWCKSVQGFAPGSIDDNWAAYQNINLFAQPGQAGLDRLWFVGMHGGSGDDWADLYALNLAGGTPVVTKAAKLHVYNSGAGQSFDKGGGLFFDPTVSAFELYAIQPHLADGKTTRINRWL